MNEEMNNAPLEDEKTPMEEEETPEEGADDMEDESKEEGGTADDTDADVGGDDDTMEM